MAANIPAAILEKMRPAEFSSRGRFEYFRLLEQMLIQIQDQIGTSQGEVSGVPSVVGVLPPISAIYGDSLDFVSVSSNYQTSGNEYVRVSNNATITLNPYPDDQETVIVQPVSDGITLVSGPVIGDTSLAISKAYDVVKLTYSLEFGEWTL